MSLRANSRSYNQDIYPLSSTKSFKCVLAWPGMANYSELQNKTCRKLIQLVHNHHSQDTTQLPRCRNGRLLIHSEHFWSIYNHDRPPSFRLDPHLASLWSITQFIPPRASFLSLLLLIATPPLNLHTLIPFNCAPVKSFQINNPKTKLGASSSSSCPLGCHSQQSPPSSLSLQTPNFFSQSCSWSNLRGSTHSLPNNNNN